MRISLVKIEQNAIGASPKWLIVTCWFALQLAGWGTSHDKASAAVEQTPTREQLEAARHAVEEWCIDGRVEEDPLSGRLNFPLLSKIAIIDRVCGLTDEQHEKLRLAGRGDIRQIVQRSQKIVLELALAGNDPAKRKELEVEAKSLKQTLGPALIEPSGDGSLFFKSLERILTAEQRDRLQPLKVVVRAGGKIEAVRREFDEGLEISFRGPSLFGDEELGQLVRLSGIIQLMLNETQVTDAGLTHLKGLRRLQSLWLDGTSITDAGLAHLKGLNNLKYLLIARTKVTGPGLEHLKELPNLSQITLDGSAITDAGLVHVQEMPSLRTLLLSLTGVTDVGLAHLRGARELRSLRLEGTRITDAGLEQLQGLSRLYSLSLRNTAVTDAGIAHLRGLNELSDLVLDDTAVTDESLKSLENLGRLRVLTFRNTAITQAGIRGLKLVLPMLKVSPDR